MNPGHSSELLTSILRDVSRSFYKTLRILPRPVRAQIGLAYLLARTTDTIADTNLVPPEFRLKTLRDLKNRILGNSKELLKLDKLVEHQNASAEKILLTRVEESLALLDALPTFDKRLVVEVLRTITTGQEQDLSRFGQANQKDIHALHSAAELHDYTYKVAGCVGEFWTRMCHHHLFPNASIELKPLLELGVRFGKGLQLVNILRDIPADLRNGRCYLPSDELDHADLKPSRLLEPNVMHKFKPVYDRWLDIAMDHLRHGWLYTNSLPYSQIRIRLACAWPLLIGFDTLALLRGRNVLAPDKRIKVTRSAVRAIAFKSIAASPFPPLWKRLAPLPSR